MLHHAGHTYNLGWCERVGCESVACTIDMYTEKAGKHSKIPVNILNKHEKFLSKFRIMAAASCNKGQGRLLFTTEQVSYQ